MRVLPSLHAAVGPGHPLSELLHVLRYVRKDSLAVSLFGDMLALPPYTLSSVIGCDCRRFMKSTFDVLGGITIKV